MEHILKKNRNGVSLAETIAYVVLYGIVMSLLASLVFVIVQTARKVNSQSILNRGATILYTEILGDTINLNPDTISNVTMSDDGNTISIIFEKKYYYNDEGERKAVSENTEYNNKTTKITYSYTKGRDNIDVKYTRGDNVETTSTIKLNFNMTITSHDSEDISKVFSVDTQNSSNKYVTFHGDLHYDNKKQEFNFIIPVFVSKDES